MKFVAVVFIPLMIAGCGAGKAVHTAGSGFDRFGCLAEEFKGNAPCPAPAQ